MGLKLEKNGFSQVCLWKGCGSGKVCLWKDVFLDFLAVCDVLQVISIQITVPQLTLELFQAYQVGLGTLI